MNTNDGAKQSLDGRSTARNTSSASPARPQPSRTIASRRVVPRQLAMRPDPSSAPKESAISTPEQSRASPKILKPDNTSTANPEPILVGALKDHALVSVEATLSDGRVLFYPAAVDLLRGNFVISNGPVPFEAIDFYKHLLRENETATRRTISTLIHFQNDNTDVQVEQGDWNAANVSVAQPPRRRFIESKFTLLAGAATPLNIAQSRQAMELAGAQSLPCLPGSNLPIFHHTETIQLYTEAMRLIKLRDITIQNLHMEKSWIRRDADLKYAEVERLTCLNAKYVNDYSVLLMGNLRVNKDLAQLSGRYDEMVDDSQAAKSIAFLASEVTRKDQEIQKMKNKVKELEERLLGKDEMMEFKGAQTKCSG